MVGTRSAYSKVIVKYCKMFVSDLKIFVLILVVIFEFLVSVNAVPTVSEYPFAVKINVKFAQTSTNEIRTFVCGGVIFSPWIVLTAAHCLYHKDERVTAVTVIAGKTSYEGPSLMEQIVSVKGYKIHEEYTSIVRHFLSPKEYFLNDIAVLWTKKRLDESNTVKAAKVSADDVLSEIFGVGLGFALINSKSNAKQLNAVTLKAIPYDTCRNVMKHYVGPNTFCALPESGGCRNIKGDSGSAFVYKGKVLGLISFQTVDKKGNVCGMPVAVTHIKKHAAMIAQSVKDGPPKHPCSKPKGKFCAL